MGKRFLISVLSLAILGIVAAKPAFAVITGSKHDFKTASWNTTGQICIVCHTPHSAGSTIAPLWNHTLSAATYSIYSSTLSPTLQAVVDQPSSSSKACLSCHDGTIALDSFGGKPNSETNRITGTDNLGTDLSNDHPVSFTYDSALAAADGDLFDPTVKMVDSLSKTIDDGMLINHKLECGSCHDVHAGAGDSDSTTSLLLVDNAKSALCLTCHNK